MQCATRGKWRYGNEHQKRKNYTCNVIIQNLDHKAKLSEIVLVLWDYTID